MGVCDGSSELHVWRLNSGEAADSRSPPEHMDPHVLPDPYYNINSAVRGHSHLVGATLHEQQEARHGAQALHDGLQRFPGRLQFLAFLGGKFFL